MVQAIGIGKYSLVVTTVLRNENRFLRIEVSHTSDTVGIALTTCKERHQNYQ